MDEKRFQKISDYLWQIVLILLGIIAVVISFIVDKEAGKVFATLNGMGISLFLSGLLGIFVNALFYRKDAKYEVCEKWKIKNIYASRAIANLTIDAYQERAKRQVDIIAFGLSSWRQEKEQLIDNMLSRKVKIRIITMDPDCDLLNLRDKAEGKPEGSTKETIIQLSQFFSQTKSRRNVELKYHRNLPLDFYFRVDDHIFVGPYLFGRDSQRMITYEFEKGGDGFDYFSTYFNSLWDGKSMPMLDFKERQ